MNEKNTQIILEGAAANIGKSHSVLLAVCTAIQSSEVDVAALMPALRDVTYRLQGVSNEIDKLTDNSDEE